MKIYLQPPARFEEIALLDASSKNEWAFTDQGQIDAVIKLLKDEAAKLGANGILLRGAGDQIGGSVSTASGTATGIGNGTSAVYVTGMAIPITYKAASGVAIFVIE